MSEAVQGCFCFTVLDNRNSLHIVKSDNPISIVHNKWLNLYLYASTDKILASAIVRSALFSYFKPTKKNASDIECVELADEEILKIDTNGKLSKNTFKKSYDFDIYSGYYNRPFRRHEKIFIESLESNSSEYDYLEDLQSRAKLMGYDAQIVCYLHNEGFTLAEIEEYLYNDACF